MELHSVLVGFPFFHTCGMAETTISKTLAFLPLCRFSPPAHLWWWDVLISAEAEKVDAYPQGLCYKGLRAPWFLL